MVQSDFEIELEYACKTGIINRAKSLITKYHCNWCFDFLIRPIHYSIKYGLIVLVQWLIEQGPDIEAYEYQRPLHMASEIGQLAIMKCLIDHGANITSRCGHNGWKAVHYASYNGHIHIIQYLLQQGADLEMKTH